MLDVLYVLGVVALFVLIALIGKAVDKLGPSARDSAPRDAVRGGERA